MEIGDEVVLIKDLSKIKRNRRAKQKRLLQKYGDTTFQVMSKDSGACVVLNLKTKKEQYWFEERLTLRSTLKKHIEKNYTI